MTNLTLENFEAQLPASLSISGRRLQEQGGVVSIEEINEDHFEACVMIKWEEYFLDIFLDEDHIEEWGCECSSMEKICPHVVAALFELKKTISRVMPKKETKQKEVSIEKLQMLYSQLAPTPKRLVKLVALNWEGMGKTGLMKKFNKMKLKHEGRNLGQQDLKPILEGLVKAQIFQRDYENKYTCPPHFADHLCNAHFSSDSDFSVIATHLFSGSDAGYAYYSWQERNNPDTLFKKMRLARYLGKTSQFKTYFYNIVQHYRSNYSQEELCNYWLPEKFDQAVITTLPDAILAFLLNIKLVLQLFDLQLNRDYFDYAVEVLPNIKGTDKDDLAATLIKLFFYRGEWQQAENIFQYLNSPYSKNAMMGIQLFAKGKTEEALAAFDVSTKLLRKKMGSNNNYLHNTEGIFHVLTRLKLQNETVNRKIDSHLKWIDKNPSYHSSVFENLKAVRYYLTNDKRQAIVLLRKNKSNSPLFTFFELFCTYWVDEDQVEEVWVKSLLQALEKNGYHWLATEMKALHHAIAPLKGKALAKLEQQQQELGIDPFITTVPKIEDWEIAIKVLLGLGNTTTQSAQKDSRLIWLVDFQRKAVQPKVQTHGKKGWTKGRVISYNRLNRKEVPCLTAQDERLISSISYGYGTSIDLDYAAEWKQLVGHPLLFLMKSPTVAVQLIEQEPRLVARAEKDGFRLSFSHEVTESTGFQLIKESPTRYVFIEVSERIAQIARAFNGKTLRVPQKGNELLKEAITGLAGVVEVESAFEEENLPTIEADARACVHLLPVGDGFHLEVYAKPFGDMPPYVKIGAGEPTLIASVEGVRTATNRNLKEEKNNLKILRNKVPILKETRPNNGIWELEDTEQCLELLVQLAPLLEEKSIILEWPKGEKFRITSIVGFDQFRMEINEKNNWFEVSGQLAVDEEKVLTMQELLELSNQKSQFVELSSGKFLALTEEFRKRLKEINGLVAAQKNGTLQLHPLAAPAIQNFTDSVQFLEADKKFKDSQDRLKAAFKKKFKVSKKFEATLRPYQKEGYEWLQRCATWGVGACLADDMGLGKTIQALALLVDRAKLGPAVVIAPASVCRNWLAETKKFAPTLTPKLFGEGDREQMVKKAKKGDVLITTYDLMTREGDLYKEKEFATIILDEAQAIKNRATKRSEVAMELNGDFKLIMTGTPIENHLGELWNLFQFANPGLLGSLDSFGKRFAIPIEKQKDENRRDQLRKLLQPFILRRKKNEVLKDLPEKTEITLSVPLSPDERAFYEALRRNAITKLASDNSPGGQKHLKILAEIMKLRRAACHPKLADKNAKFVDSAKLLLFGEIVQDLLANDHKALVFSQFVGHLKILENYLKKEKISYQYLDGSTPLKKRQQRIDAFQAGEGDIFLISLKAGGTGLNLTAADYVIHTDPWWNPAVEDQATDRAHRIGQDRPVTVYRLVAEGTIEEKILQLHEKKRDLADSLLTGTDVSAKLTAQDLLNMISEVE